MFLPRRGFYHPVTILILAAITLSIAIIFYLNSNVLFKPKPTPPPAESPQLSPEPPLTTEPISWETYTNPTLGFTINYPDNFTVSETTGKVTFTRGIKEFTVTVTPTALKNIQEIREQLNSGINQVGGKDFYVSEDDVANDNTSNSYTQIANGKQYQIYFSANLPEVEILNSFVIL